jgi:hypothetical protein
MRCWNCGKKIPDAAKVCRFCEAAVQAKPTKEEEQVVQELLEQMPPEALEELHAAIAGSKTAEEFVNRIFVGDCPKCGSQDTGDCENDPEIDNLLVGRCYQCGQLFCTECRCLLLPDMPNCDCWDDDELEDMEFEDS